MYLVAILFSTIIVKVCKFVNAVHSVFCAQMEADLQDARSGDSVLVQQLKGELEKERVSTCLP